MEGNLIIKNRIFQFLSLCFLLSGVTALIYELVWVRLFALTYGSTVYAVSVVLTAFMSGLSLGSFILGRWADRNINLLKAYAVLEAGIGVYALISPNLIDAVTGIYIAASPLGMPFWMLQGLRYGLSIMALILPTTLMGGTLPVLSRYFVRSEEELERRVGVLYAVNTIGGVIGVLLSGFLLIRLMGLSLTLRATAFLNIAIGIATFYLGRRFPEKEIPVSLPRKETEGRTPEKKPHRYAIFAFFFSGFSAMLYEVSWSRLLVAVIGSATYSFSLILMGFLLGIGIGSLAASSLAKRQRLGILHFSVIELSIGISCFTTVIFFNLLPFLMLKGMQMVDSYSSVLGIEFAVVVLYILLPTALFGATFPIIAGIYSEKFHAGRGIGNIYAANTTGCILGSAVGVFLLSGLGSVMTVKIASAINIAIGIAGMAVIGRRYLIPVSLAFLIVPFIPVSIPYESLDSGVSIYGKISGYALKAKDKFYLYLKEGLNATISVKTNTRGNISLITNGKNDASLFDMATQLALGYFPVLLHPSPENALVIGLGSGSTTRAVLDYPGISRVDCIEIEPAVIEASKFFERVNGRLLSDPRMRLVVEDARTYVVASKEKYDVIISEPSNPWISGIGNLFSKEFYESAGALLKDKGLFCQWIHLYSLRQTDLMMILRTFASVFPEASIWNPNASDILIIGSKKPLTLNQRAVSEKISGTMKWKLKAYFNISDPLDFFSFYLTGTEGIKRLSSGALLNTDDLPLLEFNAPLSLYTSTSTDNVMLLLAHTEMPSIEGLEGSKDATEFLYRKAANNMFLDMFHEGYWIKEALSASPRNPEYMIQYAQFLRATRRQNEARKLIKKAFSLAPENARANFEMAMLLRNTDKEKADFYFKRAVKLKKEFLFLNEAGNFKLLNEQPEDALRLFLDAYETPHTIIEDSGLFYRIGLSYFKLGRFDEAARYLHLSKDINPFSSETLSLLGDLYQSLDKPDTACRFYRDALSFELHENTKLILSEFIRQYCGAGKY